MWMMLCCDRDCVEVWTCLRAGVSTAYGLGALKSETKASVLLRH
jgi:hypothetical protein